MPPISNSFACSIGCSVVKSRDKLIFGGSGYRVGNGGGVFMSDGTDYNCALMRAYDSREGWANLLHDATMCLSTGGGLGVNYSAIRGKGTPIKRMGGEASGPLALMQMVNEVARHVMAGGKRRSALWAGLN